MNINTLAPAEAIEAIKAMDDIEEVRDVATDLEIKFSGNTGIDTLKGKIIDALEVKVAEEATGSDGGDETSTDEAPTPPAEEAKKEKEPELVKDDEEDEEIQVATAPVKSGYSVAELLEMDPKEEEDPKIRRQIIRAKAMKLSRVRITNLDPSDSALNGAIVSVVNKYTGKVAKYIPFGEESANGYHVPEILLNHLRNQKFALRKEEKTSRFGVKKYKTTMVPKYSIEVLPPLTKKEVEDLAALQRASRSIDK